MGNEYAIKIDGVKKMYRLGQIGGGTLQGDLQSWWARKRGKEDPNSKIGSDQRLIGQTFMALNGIDLEIKKGEAVGIIGKNGAGKSTLLKLLSRVTAPTEGTIDIYGRITSMLEVGTGFHPEMTGRENVYMNGAILGMTRAEIDSKMNQIIEFSEVGEFIDTPVKRYSSGMYVKLAFSVAAHLDSEIMIMDEVLAVGDMKFQQKCLNKMRDAATLQGKTVLYVSHNMNTIRQLCDRCIVLSEGKVVFDGDIEKAIQVYMNDNDVSASVIDFSEFDRKRTLMDGLKIKEVRILEHNKWLIKVGDKLRFQLIVESTDHIVNAGYRSRITTAEGTSISVFLARNLITCEPGDLLEITLEADTSQLVPGRYCLTPSIYAVNSYGGNNFYDHLESAITFEVDNKIGFNENMPWEQRWWGNIKLPDLKTIDIHKING